MIKITVSIFVYNIIVDFNYSSINNKINDEIICTINQNYPIIN